MALIAVLARVVIVRDLGVVTVVAVVVVDVISVVVGVIVSRDV